MVKTSTAAVGRERDRVTQVQNSLENCRRKSHLKAARKAVGKCSKIAFYYNTTWQGASRRAATWPHVRRRGKFSNNNKNNNNNCGKLVVMAKQMPAKTTDVYKTLLNCH